MRWLNEKLKEFGIEEDWPLFVPILWLVGLLGFCRKRESTKMSSKQVQYQASMGFLVREDETSQSAGVRGLIELLGPNLDKDRGIAQKARISLEDFLKENWGPEKKRKGRPEARDMILKVLFRKKREKHLICLSGYDLQNAKLNGINLGGANLRKANLVDANLRDANLSNAGLECADLCRAKLDGAKLLKAKLKGAKLSGATLESAILEGAILEGADLSGYRQNRDERQQYSWPLEESIIAVSFVETNLQQAKLTSADLRNANLGCANLKDADLSGANLSGADLGGCQLKMDLFSAHLQEERDYSLRRGAPKKSVMVRDTKSLGANLSGADLGCADLNGAKLGCADLACGISPIKIYGVKMGANLSGVDFSEVKGLEKIEFFSGIWAYRGRAPKGLPNDLSDEVSENLKDPKALGVGL